jgi:hypothetical protein
MQQSSLILCDGCGQAATQEHITQRLKRLERMTRYRPIHIQALFLGPASPLADADHLYSAEGEFCGEGAALLRALDISASGRSVEATLTDFQRRGLLLTHVLECPSGQCDAMMRREAMEKRFGSTIARIRRSFKPKKLVLFGQELDPFVERLEAEDLGAELVITETGRAFRLESLAEGGLVTALAATIPSL